MTKEDYEALGDQWITAWNQRDLETIVKMFTQDSRYVQIGSFFEPIIIDKQVLKGENYLRTRIIAEFRILDQHEISFKKPHFAGTGDYFIVLKFALSNHMFCTDTLSLTEAGLIDQVGRQYDLYDTPHQ